MVTLELKNEEAEALLAIFERYLPDLLMELADTDARDFRAFLKQREAFMEDMIKRLKK